MREYCFPLDAIDRQQPIETSHINQCINNNRKRTNKHSNCTKCAKWQVVHQPGQIKKGRRMTIPSRSRKEQRFLGRQCVASNSLARIPPPESNVDMPRIYKYPPSLPYSQPCTNSLNSFHPKSPRDKNPRLLCLPAWPRPDWTLHQGFFFDLLRCLLLENVL